MSTGEDEEFRRIGEARKMFNELAKESRYDALFLVYLDLWRRHHALVSVLAARLDIEVEHLEQSVTDRVENFKDTAMVTEAINDYFAAVGPALRHKGIEATE